MTDLTASRLVAVLLSTAIGLTLLMLLLVGWMDGPLGQGLGL